MFRFLSILSRDKYLRGLTSGTIIIKIKKADFFLPFRVKSVSIGNRLSSSLWRNLSKFSTYIREPKIGSAWSRGATHLSVRRDDIPCYGYSVSLILKIKDRLRSGFYNFCSEEHAWVNIWGSKRENR